MFRSLLRNDGNYTSTDWESQDDSYHTPEEGVSLIQITRRRMMSTKPRETITVRQRTFIPHRKRAMVSSLTNMNEMFWNITVRQRIIILHRMEGETPEENYETPDANLHDAFNQSLTYLTVNKGLIHASFSTNSKLYGCDWSALRYKFDTLVENM